MDRLCRPGQELAQDSANITVRISDWFYPEDGDTMKPKPQRRELHARLKEQYRGKWPLAQKQRRAVILAGAPGAGKSTLLTELLEAHLADYLVLDADDFN